MARHRFPLMPSSFWSPRAHARDPARDVGAESLVLSSKRLLKRRLFVRHDEPMAGEPEQRIVDDETPIAQQHRLTQNDGEDRKSTRITHVTVETCHYEIPGRRDRRGGAQPLQCETPK